MEVAYTIGGGGYLVKKFRTDDGATLTSAGVPVVSDEDTAASQGVKETGSTTTALNMIGLSVDATAASTAAQVASDGGELSNGDNATFVSVCVNPDAVYRCKLNEGSTEDTALVISVQTAASADGLSVASSPAVADNATVWGYNGANNGVTRQTSAADTVVLAFRNDIAASDEWLFAELIPGYEQLTPTLTTLLTQLDANTAGGDGTNFNVLEFELRDISNDGRNNSFALLVAYDHAYSGSHLV